MISNARTALCVIALALGCSSATLRAQGTDIKALALEACSSAEIKQKILDLIEKSRGKEERAIIGFEVERDCAHFSLSDKPKHDTADPAPGGSHTSSVMDVRFNADGKRALSAGRDGTVRLWDASTGKPLSHIKLPAPVLPAGRPPQEAYIKSAIFVGDGTRLAVAQYDGPVLVFETATGKQLAEIKVETQYGWPPKIAATRAGLLLYGGKDGFVHAVDPLTGTETFKIGGHANGATSLAISETAGLIASGVKGRELSGVLLSKLQTGEPMGGFKWQDRQRNAPDAMAFSADGGKLAVAFGGTVVVYDLKTQQELQRMIVHPLYLTFAVAFTADGSGLITCQSHPMLWDIATGKALRHFGPFTDLCHAVDVSADGKFAVTGSLGPDVRIWEIASGAFERRLGKPLVPQR